MISTSVVIATKNSMRTIEQCLSSLTPYYEQGYIKDIVVVDGHSSDGTLEVLKKYPVKLLFDEGQVEASSAAYDQGWQNAQGELVMFLDSDAYLRDGFLPKLYDFFQDDEMGIVGAEAQTAVINWVGRIITQWDAYHSDKIEKIQDNPSLSWFERLYRRGVWFGEPQVTVTGPCFIVRRNSLETVGGFRSPQEGRPLPWRIQEDYLLSHRIVEGGQKATWWLGAPVYHYPRLTFSRLQKQHFRIGIGNAFTEKYYYKASRLIMTPIKYLLGAPVFGLLCTLRFKDPLHLFLFPLTKYAMLAGYLYGLVIYKKGQGRGAK
jgi:glycosyltransferase involved in cell wall biosynthesis